MTDRSTSQDSIKLLRKDAILKSLKDVQTDMMEEIGIYLAQKMSPEKRDELIEAIQKIGNREEKSVSPSPSVSEGEVSP